MTNSLTYSGMFRRYERAVWSIVAAHVLLAAIWALSPGTFPRRPMQNVPSPSTYPSVTFDRKGIPPSRSSAEQLLGSALIVCCLGLLQARTLGDRAVPGLTLLFVVLNVCTVAGFWFLSLHRGSLSDRGPDAFVRSVSWTCFEVGLVVAGLNVCAALVKKQSRPKPRLRRHR